VSKQYDLNLQSKDYRSGKVLFPGWLGDFRLLYKLMEKGMNPDKALKVAQDFGFNCARMSAPQAQELGVADFTVAAETDLIPQAIAFFNQPFTPIEQDLLSIPNILIKNEISLESPGTKARYYLEHMFRGQTVAYDRVAEMATELMIDAMTHGLTNRPLPYGNKKVFK
jgi:enoyl-CoA hydratase/carnithine racemase